jgi:protein-tyrosine phosphatase
MPSSSIGSYFQDCIQFIDQAIAARGAVLVHCLAGISRSATVVIAYMMASQRLTLLKATVHVKARRHWANPNPGFVSQLRRFESDLASS